MRWLQLLQELNQVLGSHQSNHLLSGSCRLDAQEEPRALQTHWRSEGGQRNHEEEEEEELSLVEL